MVRAAVNGVTATVLMIETIPFTIDSTTIPTSANITTANGAASMVWKTLARIVPSSTTPRVRQPMPRTSSRDRPRARVAVVSSRSSTGMATENTVMGHSTPTKHASRPSSVASVVRIVTPSTDQKRAKPKRRLSRQSGSSPT
jgi:hypothetical protein